MTKKDTEKQMKPVLDFYRDNLNNIMENNINDEVLGRNNLLQISKLNTSIF